MAIPEISQAKYDLAMAENAGEPIADARRELTVAEAATSSEDWAEAAAFAATATARAVLALLDYLQQDDEPEPAAYRKDRENLTHLIEARDAQILHLQEDLEGARAALRARNDALNTEMKDIHWRTE